MNMNYNNADDIIAEESFLSWFYKTDQGAIDKWNKWMAEDAGNKALVEEAVSFLEKMQIRETPVSHEQLVSAETRLMESIAREKENEQGKVVSMPRRKLWYAIAAAAVIGLLFFGARFYYSSVPVPQIATTYGQIKQEKLPDGTEVILNANSNVSYRKNWKEDTDREVWLNGEAFFHVKKTAHKNKFTVHTDAFDIEVTGTSFNVVNRDGISTIILKEGSVKIHRKGEPDIAMVPGDVVEFSNQQIQKKTVQKTDYMAWTENKLVFDNTPIEEVARTIRQHYGVEVNLKGTKINDKTITGILPNDNLTVLLEALEATQDFEITRSKDVITIKNRN